MKKFVYAIMLAVLPALAMSVSSCSDDENDLPNVSVSLDVENATIVNGTIYVVQGDSLDVKGIQVKNNEAGKSAAITNVRYFMDGFYLGQSLYAPFPASNLTNAETSIGNYNLGISCTILAVDKSIAVGYLNYPVKVVESADQIPGNGSGSDVATLSMQAD